MPTLALRPCWLALRPLQLALRALKPLRLAIRTLELALRALLHAHGWINGQTDGHTEFLPILQDFVPCWGRYPATL